MPAFAVQIMLTLGIGVPIFVLFPLLIYAPKVWNSLKSRIGRSIQPIKHRVAEGHEPRVAWVDGPASQNLEPNFSFSEWEGTDVQRELKRSTYWRQRFLFAVLLWMNFVSFISADFAMQALPIPGMACFLAENSEWLLKADPAFVCFSAEMSPWHLAGSIFAAVFTIAFPTVLYSKLRRISVLNLWDSEDCVFQLGYFYDPYKKSWRYLFILSHMQLCVLVTVVSVVFSADEMALAAAPLIPHILYLAVIVFGQPFESRLDNILESLFITTNIFGFVLSLVRLRDPENEFVEVRRT